jgi:hypothetical protein
MLQGSRHNLEEHGTAQVPKHDGQGQGCTVPEYPWYKTGSKSAEFKRALEEFRGSRSSKACVGLLRGWFLGRDVGEGEWRGGIRGDNNNVSSSGNSLLSWWMETSGTVDVGGGRGERREERGGRARGREATGEEDH